MILDEDSLNEKLSSLQLELERCGNAVYTQLSALHSPEEISVDFKTDPRRALKVRDVVK